jgi:predicted SAM-dependent methyltransferase
MSEPYHSETSKHRAKLTPFCTGYGIDVGFGGDPITESAVRMDFETPYACTGTAPVQLGGDCRNLKWFRDNVLDYVYSSHVLEDFSEKEAVDILREWTRVLKNGGRLILLLPDQQRYLAHCRKKNEMPNSHHAIENFSAKYVCEVAKQVPELSLVETNDNLGDYSFYVVFQKKIALNKVDSPFNTLDATLKRLTALEAELYHCQARLNYVHNHPLIRPLITLRRRWLGLFVKKPKDKNPAK